jgi:hypothetical protein
MEQRTKTKTTVLKTFNSHVGSVDHNDCLVGKYATGVKENVIIGTVYTWMVMALVTAWNRHNRPSVLKACCSCAVSHSAFAEMCGMTFCHRLLVAPEQCLMLDMMARPYYYKMKGAKKMMMDAKEIKNLCTKCNVTLCIQYCVSQVKLRLTR